MLANEDIIIRVALAILVGALIGLEREKTKHAAGLRTHLLVCIGSTLITLTSIDMFPQNPAPITAAIITGIGFLGAGTIFRDKNNVRGLTTAASIWAVAGLGLALGAGAYVIAAAGTLAMMFTLEFGRIQYMITKKKRKWS
ncbi:MgtC/SapB family protein [Candidatus Woesearchaeota archaeon]|nr:MgtC/SapB family protein [Candidatus Woesearchaeota archaeon]